MSSLPSNELLDLVFENKDLIEGFKVIWFVINNFFRIFKSVVDPTLFHKIFQGILGTR